MKASRRGVVDVGRLQESPGLPAELLRAVVIDPDGRHRYSDVFRYCPRCLAHVVRGGHQNVVTSQHVSIRRCGHSIQDGDGKRTYSICRSS